MLPRGYPNAIPNAKKESDSETLATNWLPIGIPHKLAGGDQVETLALASVQHHAGHDDCHILLWLWQTFHLAKGGGEAGNTCQGTSGGAGGGHPRHRSRWREGEAGVFGGVNHDVVGRVV